MRQDRHVRNLAEVPTVLERIVVAILAQAILAQGETPFFHFCFSL